MRVLLPLLLTLLGLPTVAHAATLTVNSTADNGGSGTLRSLIAAAHSGDTITFDPTVFAGKQTITLTQGTLVITKSLTITAPAPGVAVSGNNSSQVFVINGGTASAPVALSGLTIENGRASYYGGGLYNVGTATLTNCTLTGNSTIFISGGSMFIGYGSGLYNNSGTATLTNCTLADNDAIGINGQGASNLYNDGGTATLTNDILWGNFYGEVYNTNGGTVKAAYSDIGAYFGVFPGTGDFPGTGNINADPVFLRAPLTNGPTDYGDLHLSLGSPDLGAGATQAQAPADATIPTTTIDGMTRPDPPNIGAYEVGPAVNVSSQVLVTRGGYVRIPRTTTLSQQVTLTNTGTSAITGPVSLVLDGLTSATLTNKTGTTTSSTGTPGSPYVNGANSLAPNASVSVTLRFNDPTLAAISYQTRVLAGTGTR